MKADKITLIKRPVMQTLSTFREHHKELSHKMQDSPTDAARMHRAVDRMAKDQSEIDWFGASDYEELTSESLTFKFPDQMKELFERLGSRLSNLSVNSKLEKRKLAYNSLGLGVFSFDRAMMAARKATEYYSPSQGVVVPTNEVAFTLNGHVWGRDNSPVELRDALTAEGKPKISSRNKEVYAYFKRKKGESSKPKVDIIINPGGASTLKGEALLYPGLTALHTANQLLKAGVMVRIMAIAGSGYRQRNKTVKTDRGIRKEAVYDYLFEPILIKDYNQTIDPNLTALVTADPRFFRYEMIRAGFGLYEEQGIDSADTYVFQTSELPKLVEEFQKAFDPEKRATVLTYGGNHTLDESARLYEKTITQIAKILSNE